MKKIVKKIKLNYIFMIIGILMCSYPIINGWISSYKQQELIGSYEYEVEEKSNIDLEKEYELAKKYNEILFKSDSAIVTNEEILSTLGNYEHILDLSGTGVMGTIQIPLINVNLPIYHGTDDKVLSNAVGHIEYSSFPVGGKNTRALISAHRGLPTSKLFTRLDELKEGDLFFIKTCGKKLAYEINEIEVIKPEQMELLDIVENEDLVSLITCTPYGVNTHRLIVTGHRVPYVEQQEEHIEPKMLSLRELAFSSLPFLCIVFLIFTKIKNKRKEKSIHEIQE